MGDTPSPQQSPGDLPVLAPHPPPRIPDHELLRRIGRGAYGEVWLARSVTGALRAVKIVHRQSFDHDRPFEREFEGILQFEPISRRHESQVDILHVGRNGDCFYYVMELADDQATGGQINPDHYTPRTLKSDLMFHGRLPFEECVRIGLALATALEHLHGAGLVHRDVKPSNIIFVNGVPKLADIGLVAGVDTTRSYVGTEGFAAPEGPGTAQADIFSLGKVLYELATGKDRQEFPDLPTQLRELPDREGLMELNAVMAKACRHDPKDRYGSAAAMRADLELLQSGKSLARIHRLERQLRVLRRMGMAVAVLAIVITAGWFWQARQTGIVKNLAEEKSRLATEKTSLADSNARLAEENRGRVVRLSIANGVRLLDEDDAPASLLWFAQALSLVTNRPGEELIHRIRIQQVVSHTQCPMIMVPGGLSVRAGAFSPDGHRVALGSVALQGSRVEIRDSHSGRLIWQVGYDGKQIGHLRFSREGSRLLVGASDVQGRAVVDRCKPARQIVAVLNAANGEPVFPIITENLVRSAFSPDDRWFALARKDCVIELRDARNGQPVAEMKGHTGNVRMLSFSADCSVLASSSLDHTVRLWHLPSGKSLGAPFLHDRPLARAVLSDDGRRLLTATDATDSDEDCRVQLWDTVTGERVGQALSVAKWVTALCFLPGNSRRFLIAGGEFEVDVRDSRTLEPVYPPIKMNSSCRGWDFSPDCTAAVVGSDDGRAYLWELSTGKLLHPPFAYTGWKESVQFRPDGKSLLTTSEGGTAEIRSLQTVAESARLVLTGNLRKDLPEFNPPRGRTRGPIPVEIQGAAVRLVDPERLVEIATLDSGESGMTCGLWAEGGTRRFWITCEAREYRTGSQGPCIVYLWQLHDSVLTKKVMPHPGLVVSAVFTPDGSRVVTMCQDGSARIWRTSDGSLERTIRFPNSSKLSDSTFVPCFTPDATALLTVRRRGEERILQLFDLANGLPKGIPISDSKAPGMDTVRFSPDGTRLVAFGNSQSLGDSRSFGNSQSFALFNLLTGDLAAPWAKQSGRVLDVDWSPDGSRLVSAGRAPFVQMWDAATGASLNSQMTIGLQDGRAARWSAAGQFIFTRSDDNMARVWDSITTEAVTPLLKHVGYIRWGCITSGNRLITASDPNVLRAWDLKPTLLPLDVVADYARLLSGSWLNGNGVLVRLQSDELKELNRSLHVRAPELFTQP